MNNSSTHFVERRDEPAAACSQLANGNFEIKYWDGARCIITKTEAEQNRVVVGTLQPPYHSMNVLWFGCLDPECEMVWACERSGALVSDIVCPACQGEHYRDLGQSDVHVPRDESNLQD